MDEIHAARGERVKVVRRSFSSVPMDYRFSARASAPGDRLTGIVEIRKSRWILPGPRAAHPLEATNVVSAGFWNTFVSVDVIPDADAVITIDGRRVRNLRPLLFAALLIVALAASFILAFRAY
jgi:hypothetical protein